MIGHAMLVAIQHLPQKKREQFFAEQEIKEMIWDPTWEQGGLFNEKPPKKGI